MRSVLAFITLFFPFATFGVEPKGQSSPDWVDKYVEAQLCQSTLHVQMPVKFQKILLSAYRAYLNEAKAEAEKKWTLRSSIPFKGENLPVLGVLGFGASGIFYAVETSEGIRTVEECFETEVAHQVGRWMTRADLRIYGQENNFVMQDFVLGLPESRIAKASALRGLGVSSPVLAREIAKWTRAHVTDTQTYDRDDVLIEIPSGRIVQLFPYPSPVHDPNVGPSLIHEPHDAVSPTPTRTTIDTISDDSKE
jgi:hypothetical protein